MKRESLEHDMELKEKNNWHNEARQYAKMYNGIENLPIEKIISLTRKYVESEWMGGYSLSNFEVQELRDVTVEVQKNYLVTVDLIEKEKLGMMHDFNPFKESAYIWLMKLYQIDARELHTEEIRKKLKGLRNENN